MGLGDWVGCSSLLKRQHLLSPMPPRKYRHTNAEPAVPDQVVNAQSQDNQNVVFWAKNVMHAHAPRNEYINDLCYACTSHHVSTHQAGAAAAMGKLCEMYEADASLALSQTARTSALAAGNVAI